jgi:hypothetical protein
MNAMSGTTDEGADDPEARYRKGLVVRASELVLDPEGMAAMEGGYRRGVHHGLAFAIEIVESSGSLQRAIERLAAAEALAGELRHSRQDEGGGCLLDHMRRVLSPRRR